MISTVPSGSHAGSSVSGTVRTLSSLGTMSSPARTAICGSPDSSAAPRALPDASASSMSISAKRSGFSDCAERTRPHSAALARSDTSSPGAVAIARRVRKTSRDEPNRSSASQSWTSDRARRVASRTDAAQPGAGGHETSTMGGAELPESAAPPSAPRSE